MNDILHTDELSDAEVHGLEWIGTPEAQAKLIENLAAARVEFGSIDKDREGQYGNQRFKYSPLGTLTEATAKPLARHGIVCLQSITNSPVEGKHRLHTTIAGHGARIVASLDFAPQQAKEDGQYKGEWIKEYGKLCTYLCRYAYKTTFVLDSEPDADDAEVPQQPQKRREAPTPPQPRQEQKAAPARQEARATQTPPVQHPGHFTNGQLQIVPAPVAPPPTKPDPLLEKLTTVAPQSETRVAPPEPTVAPEADEPVDQDLQDQFMVLYNQLKPTKINFSRLCHDVANIPPIELKNSARSTRMVMEAMRQQLAKSA